MEHLDLLLKVNEQRHVTWEGRFRPALHEAEVTPRAFQPKLPIWIGIAGNPQSAARAGTTGLPMIVGLIGGLPSDVAPAFRVYREAASAAGHDPARLGTGTSSHMHIAPTSQGAREAFYPHYAHYLNYHSRGRLRVSREAYERAAGPGGALYVGSPQEIIEKALAQHELFGHTRILGQMDIGALPYPALTQSVGLFATEVAPTVRAATARE